MRVAKRGFVWAVGLRLLLVWFLLLVVVLVFFWVGGGCEVGLSGKGDYRDNHNLWRPLF